MPHTTRIGPERRGNGFIKASIAVDTEHQAIAGVTISRNPIHDVSHAEHLLTTCHRMRRSTCYVMDTGYDSEDLHGLIHHKVMADSLIPVRDRPRKKIHGRYRRELARSFNHTPYHRRNLGETAFSVLKRRFGESLKGRIYWYQITELTVKILIDNLNTLIKKSVIIVFIEDFYRTIHG